MTTRSFPPGFVWGVATSAFQIEGAHREGGRGESIWDRFALNPGAIGDGSDGSVACDHYRRWRDDLALMRGLGVGAYRFSVAWPRVLPRGRGAVNATGLDFYDALVDGLLEAGIRPFATLYHWDLPQALQDAGGWASRRTAEAFVEYAEAVSMRLGDRVRDWATHNEPWCVATLGHEVGAHAPGHRDPAEALRVAHHLLLSHGWTVPVLRRNSPGAQIGIVLNLVPGYPASGSDADREALRSFDGQFNRWYLDPLFRGSYPSDAVEDRARAGQLAGGALPFIEPGDLRAIAEPLDWLGVNYYSRAVLRGAPPPGADRAAPALDAGPPAEATEMGWEVYPQGLYDLLIRVHLDYAPARIYLTENGAAYSDRLDGRRVADPRRREFLRGHLLAAHRALGQGVPLAGYFLWSLMDNFEWQHGYTKRFGVVFVDFATQERIPKDSAQWYRDVVAANAVDDAEVDAVPRAG